MSLRADTLAKTLLARLQRLEGDLLDDAVDDEQADTARRQELVARVLSDQLGNVDSPTVQIVTSGLPRVTAFAAPTAREIEELAEFFRVQLPGRLE